jgi:WD40 repeat protein
MNTPSTNPYVGPRTFQKNEGHLFFGRDRETRDLLSLVSAEKLVLFYAQSGAGKSSLINTRLMPSLEAKNYEVLRIGRIGGEDSPDIQINNIYVFNLLRSLIQRDVAPEILDKLNLSEFLAGLERKKNGDEAEYIYEATLSGDQEKGRKRRVLIIDQFEEIFSTHPEAWSKREDFFDQVAQALGNDPYLWVVLVMREDYIAALDPYAPLMPGGLRTRYYMQRLSQEAAIRAVRGPVENRRPYEEGVAEKLVRDLAKIKLPKQDQAQASSVDLEGSQEQEETEDFPTGQYVEPVQLQVVCYNLWENLPPGGTSITKENLQQVGDVDEALGRYFDVRVAGVAQSKGVKERLLRDWIEDKLIAPGGFRGMVMQDTSQESDDIRDDVIQALQSDLVRAENRGGTIWYELTHDRLVGPILASNKRWFEQNLSPLQRQATLWHDQKKNESWLLLGQGLAEVEKWAANHRDEIGEREEEFLAACRDKQAQIKLNEQARSARRTRRFLTVALSLLIFAVVAAIFGFVQSGRAAQSAKAAIIARETAQSDKATAQVASTLAVNGQRDAEIANATAQAAKKQAVEQANKALASSLAAQADSMKNRNYALALLFGMEAYQRDDSLLTRTTLFQLLQFTPYERQFGFSRPVSNIAIRPDGKLVAAASCSGARAEPCTKGVVKLYDENMNEIRDLSFSDYRLGPVYALAFSPDGKYLAVGGCIPTGKQCSDSQGQISLWDVTNPDIPSFVSDTSSVSDPKYKHKGLVKTLAFSPSGERMASGSYDETIILWEVSESSLKPINQLRGHFSFVNSVTFIDDNNLASASDDKTIALWRDISVENRPWRIYVDHDASISSISYNPNVQKVASASDDKTVLLWEWSLGALTEHPMKLQGHTGFVKSVTFSEDGTILASAGFDNRIILWDTHTGEQIGPPLSAHSSSVNDISFGVEITQDNFVPYLVSASDDQTVIRWDLSSRRPLSQSVNALPEGLKQLTSTEKFDSQLKGQRLNIIEKSNRDTISLAGHSGLIRNWTFNTQPLDDRFLLASAGEDQVVIVWDVTDISDTTRLEFLKIDGFDNPVREVYFDANGTYLYTVEEFGESERITQWNLDPQDWSTFLACKAVKQNLTQATWDEFLKRVPDPLLPKTCVIEMAGLR